MEPSPNLIQSILEAVLKREGLHGVIPHYRRGQVFPAPILSFWLGGLWLSASFFYFYLGKKSLLVSFFTPVILFIIFFLLVVIYYVVRSYRLKKDLSSNDAASFGGIFIFGTPILVTLHLGLAIRSWLAPLYFLGIYIGIIILTLVLNKQGYRIFSILELFVSVVKAFGQSLRYLLVILPLLLIIILLSVFSSDLWKIIGLAPFPRLFSIFALILFPALILYISSLSSQAKALLSNVSKREHILVEAEKLPILKKQLDEGLISEEEWQELLKQLNWRHYEKLINDIWLVIYNKTKRWLALLIGLTSLVLLLSFFLYFYIFFSVAIDPQTISDWTGLQNTPPVWVVNISGSFGVLSISAINVAIAKVSLILATFAAAMSIVYSLTDETVKGLFTNWLVQKSSLWVAACCLYKSFVEPNYQFWEYVVDNKKDGIANISIVTPKGLSEEKINDVCTYVAKQHEEYRRIVIVTAFEQNLEKALYKRSAPGRWWQYLHNKANDIKQFDEVPSYTDEVRYNHFLGRACLEKGDSIPDEWFGESPNSIKLSKAIWDADTRKEWILHPYVSENGNNISLDINLSKKKKSSAEYRAFAKQILKQLLDIFPNANLITVDLYFRDTVDFITNLMLNRELDYVSYRDERSKKLHTESLKDWL
jgi:hypothetical protein